MQPMTETCDLPLEISIENARSNNSATIVDCRSVEEYEEGHLQEALNVPLQHLSVLIDDFPCNRNEQLFVYCKTGNRSGTFAIYLRSLGFTKCQSIKGGYELWGNEPC